MDYYDDLMELCDTVSKHIGEANDKIRESNGKLTGSDVEYVDKLTHTLKSIKTTLAMMEAEDGYSSNGGYDGGTYNGNMGGGSYNRGGSYARGRGSNAKRDSMGRYSSNGGGYSRHGEVTEEIKKDIQRLADKVEQM